MRVPEKWNLRQNTVSTPQQRQNKPCDEKKNTKRRQFSKKNNMSERIPGPIF